MVAVSMKRSRLRHHNKSAAPRIRILLARVYLQTFDVSHVEEHDDTAVVVVAGTARRLLEVDDERARRERRWRHCKWG
ncbi:hypothetical protein A9K55_008171 [Cordyceps militaris]|uniref:Uncharacterized protein n=1 Tax=Cordyceps militaris TaxID=73501 RepID=A0A2H4SEP4_CORMI|nr:hypothetical protein A9K55_008171 [Cordyceps militaris]